MVNHLPANRAVRKEHGQPPPIQPRRCMLKTIEYHLEDDPEAMAQITHIRAGSGHIDLANDLSELASMYKQYRELIKHDKKNYRETDEADARGLSEQILRLLGAVTTPEQATWKGYQARAAKLLFESHDEAIRVGRFLFFYDAPEGRFPSLFTAVRAAPTAAAKTNKDPATDGASPPEGDG
jgi:hypothetical protein